MRKVTRYKHLGYFNEVGDIREFINMSADDIINYWKEGYGAFFESKVHEEDADIILEDEVNNIASGYTIITTDRKYAISNGAYNCTLEEFEGDEDGDDSEVYVDIYELYTEETIDSGYFEFCPHCETEVEFDGELKVFVCPECGKHIVACSMCPKNENCDCSKCPLCELANILNRE